MNKRLQQFLSAENISQSQFADKIGVTKASVSHILSGRNKPGFEFIESMADCYPNLNLDWLIGGKGRMYKNSDHDQMAMLSQVPEKRLSPTIDTSDGRLFESQEPDLFPQEPEVSDNKPQPERLSPSGPEQVPARITKILVFYDNGTFKEIN